MLNKIQLIQEIRESELQILLLKKQLQSQRQAIEEREMFVATLRWALDKTADKNNTKRDEA